MADKRDKGKRGVFQTVEVWAAALLTIPDAVFFETARNALGTIKTPFSKQRLIEDLTAFLSRPEIGKAIGAYIDEADHKIIAAVALLAEPDQKELEAFFEGEYTPARLNTIVLNLEERLIMFRRTVNTGARVTRVLSLNPVIKEALTPFITDKSVLFPSMPAKEPLPEAAFSGPDARTLAALLAYVEAERGIFKTTGELRKKVYDQERLIFGGLDFAAYITALLKLHLLSEVEGEAGSLRVDWKRVSQFAAASERDRRIYLAIALYIQAAGTNVREMDFIMQGRINRFASFVASLFNSLNDSVYPWYSMRRQIQIMENSNVRAGYVYDDNDRIKLDKLLEALELVGLLVKTEEGFRSCFAGAAEEISSHASLDVENETGKPKPLSTPAVVFDGSSTFYMCPEIDFAEAMKLASFSSLALIEVNETGASSLEDEAEEAESAVPTDKDGEDEAADSGGASAGGKEVPSPLPAPDIRFELQREAVIRAFERGMSDKDMTSLLQYLSADRLPENAVWQLGEWRQRYNEVALYEGLALTLAPDRRYLADVEPLSSLVQEKCAEGVYILNTRDKDIALRALHRSGVDIVRTPAITGGYHRSEPSFRLASGSREAAVNGGSPPPHPPHAVTYGDAISYKSKFRAALDARKSAVMSKNERDELLARIERRLIVAEEQLTITSAHLERLEARGLDFNGKNNIARQALSKGSMLEITIADGADSLKTIVGTPLSLEKQGGDPILVFKGVDGEDIRMPLGKIGVVRRVKNSIFE